ncbi:hypothetical protein HHI36_019176 [Cryptolaemus montrouzieri]|uniref:Uncharacterized protein n=1 Tax=Cryptolaemus montrouzieri TaxID=559131 RepID=A0ABD2P368_9CUCU
MTLLSMIYTIYSKHDYKKDIFKYTQSEDLIIDDDGVEAESVNQETIAYEVFEFIN